MFSSNNSSPPPTLFGTPNNHSSPPPSLTKSSPNPRTPTGLMFRSSEDLIAAAMDSNSPQPRSPPHPLGPAPPPPAPSGLLAPGLHHPGLEHLRLQQLYTLAFADRMRFLHGAANPMLAAAAAAAQQHGGPPFVPPAASSQAAMAHLSQLAAAAAMAATASNPNTPPRSVAPPPAPQPPPPPPPLPPSRPAKPMKSSIQQTANPPTISDFPQTHPLAAYYGKFDPRLFRMTDEPKPQHSYIGLISMAILSCQEMKLVLADIYQYILDNYSYFRHRGPGWRNSIRHNLSLNDCFIKAGRAANGKGHYWAIHPACLEDFKRGDYRRRKAQRKVRKHMGLAVDEEDSPSPPPPPFAPPGTILPLGWPTVTPAGVRIPPPIIPHPMNPHQPHAVPHHPLPLPECFLRQNPHLIKGRQQQQQSEASAPTVEPRSPGSEKHSPISLTPTSTTEATRPGKRLFDVASLLGNTAAASAVDSDEACRAIKRPKFEVDEDEDDEDHAVEDEVEDEDSFADEEEGFEADQSIVTEIIDRKRSKLDEDLAEDKVKSNNNESNATQDNDLSVDDEDHGKDSGPAASGAAISPQEYLARYYQLMQQQAAVAQAAAQAAVANNTPSLSTSGGRSPELSDQDTANDQASK